MTSSVIPLSRQEIKDILLKAGFKEKLQPNGELDLNPYVYEGVEEILKQVQQRQEPALCEDEGCPHHGTPHVCVEDSDLDRSLRFFWGSCYWTNQLTGLSCLSEETKAFLLEKSREVDCLRASKLPVAVGVVRVLPTAGNGVFFNVSWTDVSRLYDGATLFAGEIP